jgi:uncharacterized protein YkwD
MNKIPLALSLVVLAALLLGAPASASVPVFDEGEVAPVEICPDQTEPALGAREQAGVMFCMLNFARATNGLVPLQLSRTLGRAAEKKSADILGCDQFSHEACGRPFAYWDRRFGYLKGCWKVAENIAWGTGTFATVRSIVTHLLESPEHHANILGPYRQVGFGLRVGDLEGNEGAAVWSQDFGSRRC